MHQGKLIVQPMGGLANRMRVISVLASLCQEVGATFEVWWASNSDLGAQWEDIFERPNFRIRNINGSYIHAHRSRKWYKSFTHQAWAALNGFRWMPYEDVCILTAADTPENSSKIREGWKNDLKSGEHMFVCTGDNLGPVNDLSMFKPIVEVQNRIESFLTNLDDPNISLYGLHIRRTDNNWSRENSPICLFVEKIKYVLNFDPTARFYLATDDNETINYLKDKFGERIIFREKDFRRSTVSGIQDAIVDMWILSHTKKIYGSYFSSFSEMASWIGNVELVIIKNE